MKQFISFFLFLMVPILCFTLEFEPPMKEFGVSSECGYRNNPLGGVDYPNLHKGVDLVGPKNARVYAVAAGIITEHWLPPNQVRGYKGHETYGGMIVIDHGNGVFTLYAHLSKTFAREGKYISQGSLIGIQGATGKATGEHLHFEIIIDPLKLLNGNLRITGSFIQFWKKEHYGEWEDR